MTGSWKFLEPHPQGDTPGSGYRNTLNASGIVFEHELAREAIQNSVDAWDKGDVPPSVRFSLLEYKGKSLKELLEVTGLVDAIGPREAVLDLGFRLRGRFGELASEGLEACLIEDYGTIGLGGHLHKTTEGAHFRKLLYDLASTHKTNSTDPTGGSYGFGKSVYSSASDLRTIIAYTRFEPSDESEGTSRRLIGCSYFESHEYGGESYTGRAIWGRSGNYGQYEVMVPFVQDEADELAQRIGIPVRPDKRQGTSILILGTHLSIEKLIDGVERFWWPRLVDEELDVTIVDATGQERFPRPKKREELRPFISAYLAARSQQSGSEEFKLVRFNSINGIRPGYLVSAAYDYDDYEEVQFDSDFVNSVCLIRSIRMVVAYEKTFASPHGLPATAVFVCDSEMDTIAKLSEPGTHNKWDPSSSRLSSEQSEVLSGAMEKIRRTFRAFQNALRPKPPKTSDRVRALERLLGSIMKSTDRTRPKPIPKEVDPVNIRQRVRRLPGSDGSMRIELTLDLKLKENPEIDDTLKVAIAADGYFLADGDRRVDRQDKFSIDFDTGELAQPGFRDGEIVLELDKNNFRRISGTSPEIPDNCGYQLTIRASDATPIAEALQ